MAEKSYFFNDVNDDRVYLAEDFAMFFSTLIANGVFPNPSTNNQVLVNEEIPMAITIKPGKAWINGYLYWNPDNLVKNLEPAYTNPRIDRIVVRWVSNIREIKAYVVTGTPAAVPVAPELTRNSDVWELAIADIFIGGGATTITQANITDTRLSDNLCGIVHALVQQVQTETIFNQYLTWFDEMKASNQADFNEWFSTIQGVLSGDVAGNLLNLINDNAADIAVHTTAISNLKKFQTPGGTSTAITLTGVELTDGFQTSFVVKTSNSGSATTINTKPLYKPGTTTAPKLVAGKAVTVWYNSAGDCFFIKASAEGTATAGDVLASKTFSNDDDTGLSGTMTNRGAVTITPGTTNQAIAAGYHNGSGYVAGDADLVAGNIKKGVNIFGVDGTVNMAPYSFDTYTGLSNITGGITNAVVSADRIFYTTGVASTTLNICNVNGSIINSVALTASQEERIIGFDRYTNHIVTQRTNGGSPYINRYTTAGVFVNTYGPLNTISGFEFTENYGFNIYYTTSTYYPATWNKSGTLIRYSTTYPIGSSESQYTSIIGLANDQALYVIGYRVLRFNGINDTVLTRRLPANGAFLQPK